MKDISFRKHKIEWILVILSIIALIFYTLRFTTIFDEDYTLQLIHNSFPNIIKFDSLDVHPPLYYFLLKIFLEITTFWTNSFLIKIFFARIFSVIVSLITFVFLFKISGELGIKNNILIQWLLFLFVPGVISFTYEFIKIRMYSLGALLIVIEFYELIRYDNNYCNYYLIFATLSSILAFYTNYFAAFIAGVLLLIYMIKYLLFKNKHWICIFFSGIVTIIAFLPWIPLFLRQISLQSQHPQGGFFKQWIATLVLSLIFIFPLYEYYKALNKKFLGYYFLSFIMLLTLFIVMSIISVVNQSIFQFRYLYPIFLIYSFIGNNEIFVICDNIMKNYYRSIAIIILVGIISVGCVGAYTDQMFYYNISSYNIISQFSKWKNSKNDLIHLPRINNPDQGFDIEKMMYLSKVHKKFNAPKNVCFIKRNISYKHLFNNVNQSIRN